MTGLDANSAKHRRIRACSAAALGVGAAVLLADTFDACAALGAVGPGAGVARTADGGVVWRLARRPWHTLCSRHHRRFRRRRAGPLLRPSRASTRAYSRIFSRSIGRLPQTPLFAHAEKRRAVEARRGAIDATRGGQQALKMLFIARSHRLAARPEVERTPAHTKEHQRGTRAAPSSDRSIAAAHRSRSAVATPRRPRPLSWSDRSRAANAAAHGEAEEVRPTYRSSQHEFHDHRLQRRASQHRAGRRRGLRLERRNALDSRAKARAGRTGAVRRAAPR